MRILLDECLDRRVANELADFKVTTVPKHGWAGIKNGELLRLAENEFDVFITVDRNLTYQQNLQSRSLAIIVLSGHGIRLQDLRPIIPELKNILSDLKCGDVKWIGDKPNTR